jgi:hypothetical protein
MEDGMFAAERDFAPEERQTNQARLAWTVGMGIWLAALLCLAVFF